MKFPLEVELNPVYVEDTHSMCVVAEMGGVRMFQTASEPAEDSDYAGQERRHIDLAHKEVMRRLALAMQKAYNL